MTHASGVALGVPIRVLIAEDAPHRGAILEPFLVARGFNVFTVRDGQHALDVMRLEQFDVALLDIVMPGLDGLEVLRQVREDPSPPEVIIITGNGTIEEALAALTLGAYDVLSKPYRMAEIEELVRRAWEKRVLARDNARLQRLQARQDGGGGRGGAPAFVTQYAPLQAVVTLIERVAPSSAPVLVSGESGTGKDLVARLLHHWSGRDHAPFVELNCAAMADHRLEAELFGVEKGALPGAERRTVGLLELASGGTLCLDHVADLDLRVQGRLMRALETGSFHRVGGTQKVDLDVRLVAATTRDLGRMAASGDFRDDLMHRLTTIRIQLPALRERSVDVPLLAEHFLTRFGGATPPRLASEALAALERYRWPGNVRELRTVIERAVLLAVSGTIEARDLPLGAEGGTAGGTAVGAAGGTERGAAGGTAGGTERGSAGGAELGATARLTPTHSRTLAELERRHIESVLQHTRWHQGRAAELLGISAKTLYRKIREYGFHRPARGEEGAT